MSDKNVVSLLRNTINTLVTHRIILFPYCLIVFIQLFFLEVLFFFPRYPLVKFFGPIVTRRWSVEYLSYPLNFALLPELFQVVQAPIYLFLTSFLIALGIILINRVNSGNVTRFFDVAKEGFKMYVHIIVAALLMLLTVYVLFYLYGYVFDRAMMIRSTSGKFYILKRIVTDGTPFVHLLITVFVAAIFAYVLPIIVLEKKKIFTALKLNFKMLWKSFWFTFLTVLIPTLFYVPVLLLRGSISLNQILPEFSVIILVISTVVMVLIDAIVYTAFAIHYLVEKEEK